jgi:hypothetical protein
MLDFLGAGPRAWPGYSLLFCLQLRSKFHAERAVQRVSGVVGISNEIVVRLPSNERLDADIAHEAASTLELQLLHSVGTIRVVVAEGMLKLEGYVERNYQWERHNTPLRWPQSSVTSRRRSCGLPASPASYDRVELRNGNRFSSNCFPKSVTSHTQGDLGFEPS